MLDVAAGLENTLIPMAEAGEVLQADIHKRFETETDPSGNKWPRLSSKYILAGWRHPPFTTRRPTGTTLKDTGQLESAATSNKAILIRGDTLFYQLSRCPHMVLLMRLDFQSVRMAIATAFVPRTI